MTAPCGPPLSTAEFLDRLTAKWLQHAWGDGRYPGHLDRVHASAKHLPDIQLRYATLLGRLGPALDGPGRLEEADAWYCILEGTREPSVAEAQAMALTELAAATFVQVARPTPSPLSLLPPPAAPAAPVSVPGPRHEPAPPSWPGPPGLDDLFGTGAPR